MTDYCENGKPKDCRYCYYYGRHGCMLKVCYYDRPKPQMWEDVLNQLKGVSVANESELGVSDILTSVQDSLSNIVSYEAADKPQIKVSNLTREHLRKVLTVFMGSGAYINRREKSSMQ